MRRKGLEEVNRFCGFLVHFAVGEKGTREESWRDGFLERGGEGMWRKGLEEVPEKWANLVHFGRVRK